jgi:chemotaxis protein CheD
MVRIGELEVVGPSDAARLVTVGLGSCVGVALIDERSGTIGLAHVFLPEPPPSGPKPGAGRGTYATTAVPELVAGLIAAAPGPVSRASLTAVIAGGATMFGNRPGQDVGQRNVEAVTAMLERIGIRVAAALTRGTRGRTIWVEGGAQAAVIVREVGSEQQIVWQRATGARGTTTDARQVARHAA